MKTLIRKAAPLGTVALGLLAAAITTGCGSDASGNKGPSGADNSTGKATSAMITARSINVNGCNADGIFDIVSPQVIDFIATDQSDLTNAQLQLFTLDSNSKETRVDKSAQQADSAT